MSATNLPPSTAVVGAGLTGLTAAWRLHAAGARVRVFEAADKIGGVIQTERADGWLVEAGPNSLRGGSPELTKLIADLGLATAVVPAGPAAKNRYLVHHGRLVAAPASPPALLASPLLSLGTKARLAAELLRRPRPRAADLSLATLVREHFGDELVERALDPFVSGVYAGDAEKLSARHAFPELWAMEQQHGSLLRAQAAAARERRDQGRPPPQIFSFTDGLAALPGALAAALPSDVIALNAAVTRLAPIGSATAPAWELTWQMPSGAEQTEEFDRIILALPAAALARLPIGADATTRPLAALGELEHASIASLFLGYRREQIAHALDGFGLLVPSTEKRTALGVIFTSTLFPGRAPLGHVALTVMAGGTRRPDLAALAPAALIAAVQPDLATLLGVRGDPVFMRHHAWPHAIPQYNLGHERFLDAMARCETAHPGVHLANNARAGLGLTDRIAAGLRAADAMLK
jgi:oxygen-dependent protoporphyrinogen oxidase